MSESAVPNASSRDVIGNHSIGAVDPTLWVIVGTWMAEAGVKAAVTQAVSPMIANMLGQPSLASIEDAIRQAVQQIIGFIREELRRQITENELRRLQADTRSTLENLRNFAGSSADVQKQRVHLLEVAEVDLGKIRSLAAEFEFLGAPAFANAVSLTVLTYELLHEFHGEEQYLQNAVSVIDSGTEWLAAQLARNEKTWRVEKRLGQIYDRPRVMSVPTPNGPIQRVDVFYVFEVDGRVAMAEMSKRHVRDAHNKARARLAGEYDKVIESAHEPLRKMTAAWAEARAALVR